ncbi:MAG TPA: CAP domain-containing protein, partial [Candidatus Sulfotelmatobacter sp.]|nr:CAP domain-containing protein [Candidatus Sulfotelmatobacter sp.]
MFHSLLEHHPDDAKVHASYALFLNYRKQPAAARAEAMRAVALDAHGAHAYAVLCRVDDWAVRLNDAVVAGGKAVALSSHDPLAHIFLAEALEDHGDHGGAQAHISIASSLLTARSPAYLRAELQREVGNSAATTGDSAGYIRAMSAARDAQPQWVERATELVDAYALAGNRAAVNAVIDSAVSSLPDDPEALEALGRPALVQADNPAAKTVWQRMLALMPNNVSVIDVNAQIAMALDGNVDAAEALFTRSLHNDKKDQQAAAYLLALARYIRSDEARGLREITAVVPKPDTVVAGDAQVALTGINAARAAAALPPVALEPHLGQSALGHSFYWLFNNASPSVINLGIHLETSGKPGFRGVSAPARAQAWGYPNARVLEDITHRGTAGAAVQDFLDSVYHRFPIVRPDLQYIGFGEAQLGPLDIQDVEYGFAPPAPAAPVVYPGDGQSKVPVMFADNELPDPLP